MTDINTYVDTDSPGGGDGSIGSPYNSLSSWNANESGVVGAGDRHICNFRSGTNDDQSLTNLSGWSGAGELIIQRWSGAASALIKPATYGAQVFESSADITCSFYHLDIDMTNMVNGNSEEGIRCNGNVNIRKCQFRNALGYNQDHIYLQAKIPSIQVIEDCCFHSAWRSFILNQGEQNLDTRVINCVAWNGLGNVGTCGAIGYESGPWPSDNSTFLVINTACHVANNSDCYRLGYGGTYHPLCGHNRASDGTHTLVGPNSLGNVIFQEGAGGSGERAMYVSLTDPVDLHIIDDPANSVRDTGVGPADSTRGLYIPATDYDGDARSGLITDIGFDQIPGEPGGVITEMLVDLDQNNALGLSGQGQFQGAPTLASIQSLAQQALFEYMADTRLDSAQLIDQQANAQFLGATNVQSDNQLNMQNNAIMDKDVLLASTNLLQLTVNARRLVSILEALSVALVSTAGQQADESITLFDQESISFDHDLAFGALIALGTVQALSTDEDSALGARIALNTDSAQNNAVIAIGQASINLAQVVEISNAIEATLIAETGLYTLAGMDLTRVVETEGHIIFHFDAQMITDRLGPEAIEIQTDDFRTILISKEDRDLIISLDKRDILIL